MAPRWLLSILLGFAIVMSGCLSADTSEWGTNIEVEMESIDGNIVGNASSPVEYNDGTHLVTISGTDSKGDFEFSEIYTRGCSHNGYQSYVYELANETKRPSGKEEFKVEGWLAAVHHYPNNAYGSEDSLTRAVTTVAVIWLESFEDAQNRVAAEARVNVKDWGDPLIDSHGDPLVPKTSGEPKLDDNEGPGAQYYTLGIIPATEHILYGTKSMENHMPIKIHGFLLDAPEQIKDWGDYTEDDPATASSGAMECSITKGTGNEILLVTKIELSDEREVTQSGNSDNEWVEGDVPIVGGLGFIFAELLLGIGGAVGLFILSTMLIRSSAARSAALMMGDEGYAKAMQVKKDVKKAEQEGLKIRAPPKTKKDVVGKQIDTPEEEIKSFNLDNILSSDVGAQTMELGGGGVMMSEEAAEMEEQISEMHDDMGLDDEVELPGFSISSAMSSSKSEAPSGGRGFSVADRSDTGSRREQPPAERKHFSSAQSSSSSSLPAEGPPMKRKTRKAKAPHKSNVEKERAPPEPSKPSLAEDEDFSDFSDL